jgi:DNA helicase-4
VKFATHHHELGYELLSLTSVIGELSPEDCKRLGKRGVTMDVALWVLAAVGIFLLTRRLITERRGTLESLNTQTEHLSEIVDWAERLESAANASLLQYRWLGREFRHQWEESKPKNSRPMTAALKQYCHTHDVQMGALERQVSRWTRGVSHYCEDRNEQFMEQELRDCSDFFATVEKTALTAEQARASICMEDRVQIVAAAGSGKTSVMVAKAAYALHRGLVEPERILLLAFNKDAAEELNRRVQTRLSKAGLDPSGVRATTFHAFGLSIIGRAEGKKPSIPDWALDHGKIRKMAEIVDGLLSSHPQFPEWWGLLKTVFSSDLPAFDDIEPVGFFDSVSLASGFQTLQGETVKSREEQMIADWLYLHGVNYVYEAPYEFETADESHRQYQPDFYYPDINLYHEHFALDENGVPPAKFGPYLQGVRWKRDTHRRFGTLLFETTSAGVRGRDPFLGLKSELTSRGVVLDFQPDRPSPGRPPIEDKRLIRTMLTFLEHYKSSRVTHEQIRARLEQESKGNRERHRIFANAFVAIFGSWQWNLDAERSIDFNDMLIRASDHLKERRAPQDYDLILVDEFQDTSVARMDLVRNLANRSETQVTVVGDDWQSINRFAGADISAMTEFEQHFGENRRFELTRTFRCVQQVCDVSSQFIMKNPRQISKIVEGKPNFKSSHISIVWVDEGRWLKPSKQNPHEGLLLAIHKATEDLLPGMGRQTLKVLGRYRWETEKDRRPDLSALNELVDVSWGTIHSSKGLEADHIVIVGNDSDDQYGFPSAIEDDPVLNLVMPGIDDYAHSEERRLLYVALTRARKSVTLIGKRQKPSPFLIELQKAFDIPVMNSEGELKTERWCARCGDTLVIRINGKTGGEFYGCRSFPSCRYTEAIDVG